MVFATRQVAVPAWRWPAGPLPVVIRRVGDVRRVQVPRLCPSRNDCCMASPPPGSVLIYRRPTEAWPDFVWISTAPAYPCAIIPGLRPDSRAQECQIRKKMKSIGKIGNFATSIPIERQGNHPPLGAGPTSPTPRHSSDSGPRIRAAVSVRAISLPDMSDVGGTKTCHVSFLLVS